jgi:hypothetical protein
VDSASAVAILDFAACPVPSWDHAKKSESELRRRHIVIRVCSWPPCHPPCMPESAEPDKKEGLRRGACNSLANKASQ